MTNYEKLRQVFSRTIFVLQKNAFHETTAIMVSDEWLNSEYAEPAVERREEDFTDSLSLYDVDLLTKTRNALLHRGFKTVGQIRNLSERQLLGIPHIGPSAISDIKTTLAEYGMKLPVKDGVIKHE